jgi:hypothetical protein
VGGYAYIVSKPGEGTQVSAWIPCVLQQNMERQT